MSAARTAAETISARAATLVLGAVASLIVARELGPVGRGEYIYPTFVVGVFSVAGHLSYDYVNIHFWSTKAADARTLARTAFAISGFAGLVSLLLLGMVWAAVPDLFRRVGAELVVAAAVTLPLLVQQHALTSYLIVTFRMRSVNIATVTAAAGQLGGIVVLSVIGALTPFSVLCVTAGTVLWMWMILVAAVRPPVGLPPGHLVRRAVAYSARVHPGAVLTVLIWRGDVVFVMTFLGVRETGLYTLAVFLADMLWALVEAAMAAATPRQVADQEPARIAASVHRLAVVTLLIGAVLLGATAPILIPLLYGSAFRDALVPLLILLPGLMFFGSYRPLMVYLLRLRNPSRLTWTAGIALAVNVGGNLLLIERFGLTGVAAVASVTYAVLYTLMTRWFLSDSGLSWRELVPAAEDVKRLRSMSRQLIRRT